MRYFFMRKYHKTPISLKSKKIWRLPKRKVFFSSLWCRRSATRAPLVLSQNFFFKKNPGNRVGSVFSWKITKFCGGAPEYHDDFYYDSFINHASSATCATVYTIMSYTTDLVPVTIYLFHQAMLQSAQVGLTSVYAVQSCLPKPDTHTNCNYKPCKTEESDGGHLHMGYTLHLVTYSLWWVGRYCSVSSLPS